MTSEERREVAGRLRGMDAQDHDNEVCVDQNPSGGGAFEPLGLTAGDLADLIDPTCEVEGSIFDDTCECESPAWGYHLSCGHWLDWGDSEPPRYCPYCGCRIDGANGDE